MTTTVIGGGTEPGGYLQNETIDSLNKTLFAFAAYNCGPRRLEQLRREAQRRA